MRADRSMLFRRIGAAACVVLIEAALGLALIFGLAIGRPWTEVQGALKLFEIAPPPPPVRKPDPPRPSAPHERGAPSPANLRSQATEVLAPPPVVPLVTPPPLVASPRPALGDDASTGASNRAGPGTGAGGAGEGTGGGGDDGQTPPRWIRGRIKGSDYPHDSGERGIGGTLSVRFTVETNGRVTGCAIEKTSGDPELDRTVCRLIEKRYRYEPSRTAAGEPVPAIVVEDHQWTMDR